MKYTDLRNKTPYDFCKDARILGKIGIDPKCTDLDACLTVYKNNPVELAVAYAIVAEEMQDKDFISAVKKEFEKELAFAFNE